MFWVECIYVQRKQNEGIGQYILLIRFNIRFGIKTIKKNKGETRVEMENSIRKYVQRIIIYKNIHSISVFRFSKIETDI